MSNFDRTSDHGNINTLPDLIEREIEVLAPILSVWDIISTPGWWIVDCAEQELRRIKSSSNNSVILNDAFQVDCLDSKEPEEVSFRWTWTRDNERPVTKVKFSLASTPRGTSVRVYETGLSVGSSEQVLADHYRENSAGWEEQLALAKRCIESRQH